MIAGYHAMRYLDIEVSSNMAQLLVRNIENGVKAGLQRRARRNGRSMEEEVRDILRAAVHESPEAPAGGLGSEISKIFAKHGLDSPIPELHFEIKPPSFEK
jgi:plasmid stability protein